MSVPSEIILSESENENSLLNVDQRVSKVDTKKKRVFLCLFEDCDKSYTQLCHLMRHEEIHGNRYQCTEKNCQQSFKSTASLKKHVDNIHLKKNAKKYKCSVCDQEFNKHNWLTRHQFRHTGIKPYLCPKEGCEKRFLVPSKLKRHLKIHEGYVCSKEDCGQKFSKWTLYCQHIKLAHPTIHRCLYCERIFTSSNNLRAHSEVHNMDREVYLCPKPNCSRFYFMKRNLTHHLKAYHDKRPFVCTQEHCYKAFKSEEDMNAHISRHHQKKRVRRKKKSNPKPTFAARLAGCVPRKTVHPETRDEALEESFKTPDEKAADISHSSPQVIINHGESYSNCTDENTVCDTDNEIQTILSMDETLQDRNSFHPKSAICISA